MRTDHILTFFVPVPDTRPKDPNGLSRTTGADGGQHPHRSGRFAGDGDDGRAALWRWLWDAVYPGRRRGVQRSFEAAQYGLWVGDAGVLQTFGIALIKGRTFSEQDTASSVKVAVVNEEFARRNLKGKDPLQTRVMVEELIPGVTKLGAPVAWQIVGIYHTVRGGSDPDRPEMHVPFWQIPWPSAQIGVRTAEDPATMVPSIAGAMHRVDSQLALGEPMTAGPDALRRPLYGGAVCDVRGDCAVTGGAGDLWIDGVLGRTAFA